MDRLLASPALVRVLTYLDVRDRCAAAGTARGWYHYHCSPVLWARLSVSGYSHLVVNDHVVGSLLSRHRSVLSLDLSFCSRLSDAALLRAGPALSDLQAATLEGCRGLTDVGVAALAAGSPRLQQLNLSGCAQLTLRGIYAVVERCQGLVSLALASVPCVNDDVLAGLARSPNLASLSVGGCAAVTNEGVALLARHRGVQLREINLSYCTRLTDDCVAQLVQSCPGLQSVTLYGCSALITDAALHWLGRLPHLTSLDISMCRGVTDAGLAALVAPHRGRSPLRSLNLYDCSAVTDAGLVALSAGVPALAFLGVFGLVHVTLDGLRVVLARCPALTRLDAGGTIHETHLAALEREMAALRP